jgi:hypothetical protein
VGQGVVWLRGEEDVELLPKETSILQKNEKELELERKNMKRLVMLTRRQWEEPRSRRNKEVRKFVEEAAVVLWARDMLQFPAVHFLPVL